MAASNLKLFDENKANMLSDEEYNTNTQRLNGVQTGVASSSLQNKTLYQTSLVAYAIGQLMIANGKDATDSAAVSTFVANMDATMLQKVKDIATTEEAQQGLLNTKYMTPALTKVAIEYMCVLKSGSTMTGPLILSGAPTQENQAATKSYVDTSVEGIFEEVTFPNYELISKLAKEYITNNSKESSGNLSINYVDGEYLAVTGANFAVNDITNVYSYSGFFIKFTVDSNGEVQNFMCNYGSECSSDGQYYDSPGGFLSKIGDTYYLIRTSVLYKTVEIFEYNFVTNKLTFIKSITNFRDGNEKYILQSKTSIYLFIEEPSNAYDYVKFDKQTSTLAVYQSPVSLRYGNNPGSYSCDNGIFYINDNSQIISLKNDNTAVSFNWKSGVLSGYRDFIQKDRCFVKDNYLYAYAKSTSSSNSKYTFVRCAFGSTSWEKLFDYQGDFSIAPQPILINDIKYWYTSLVSESYVSDIEKLKIITKVKTNAELTGYATIGNYLVSINYSDSSGQHKFSIYIVNQNPSYTFQNIKNVGNDKLAIAAVDSSYSGDKIVLYDGGTFKIIF